MKEKIKQKGFIQIPLLVIAIISIVIASAGTGVVLHKQGKLTSFIANISDVFKKTGESISTKSETEIKSKTEQISEPSEENIVVQIPNVEKQVDYNQAIEQLQQEIIVLKQQQQQGRIQNDTQQLQQRIINLQQQLQQVTQQQETESTLQASSKLDINQLISLVVQVDCSGGWGSGFSINSEGWIVTNHHVVEEPMYEQNGKLYRHPIAGQFVPGCVVSFTNNSDQPPNIYYWATIAGSYNDPEKDLAILYIQAEFKAMDDLRYIDNSERNFPFIFKCSKNDFAIGDEIVALGYPGAGGDTITVTNGILSGVLGIHYKISAKLNPGNSGGPIILNNEKGCYIGVVKWASLEGIESQPYAVKAEFVPF